MAKAASPIRLESTLMNAATLAGSTLHRSAAEQIEYWANLGRKLSKIVDPEDLLAINAGLATLSLEKSAPVAVNPDAVFASLANDRDSGVLRDAIAANAIRYQASAVIPSMLEQVHPDGSVCLGQFVDGKFIAQHD